MITRANFYQYSRLRRLIQVNPLRALLGLFRLSRLVILVGAGLVSEERAKDPAASRLRIAGVWRYLNQRPLIAPRNQFDLRSTRESGNDFGRRRGTFA